MGFVGDSTPQSSSNKAIGIPRGMIYTVEIVDGRNPAPVELGSLSHYLQRFFTYQLVVWDFFHQQYDFLCVLLITGASSICAF